MTSQIAPSLSGWISNETYKATGFRLTLQRFPLQLFKDSSLLFSTGILRHITFIFFCSKDVRLPVQLQRAMAAEAEAAREARAKVRDVVNTFDTISALYEATIDFWSPSLLNAAEMHRGRERKKGRGQVIRWQRRTWYCTMKSFSFLSAEFIPIFFSNDFDRLSNGHKFVSSVRHKVSSVRFPSLVFTFAHIFDLRMFVSHTLKSIATQFAHGPFVNLSIDNLKYSILCSTRSTWSLMDLFRKLYCKNCHVASDWLVACEPSVDDAKHLTIFDSFDWS